jgi:hypothetical protein
MSSLAGCGTVAANLKSTVPVKGYGKNSVCFFKILQDHSKVELQQPFETDLKTLRQQLEGSEEANKPEV